MVVTNGRRQGRLDNLAHYSAGPFTVDHTYFTQAEYDMQRSWSNLVWPMIRDCDCTSVIDLAAGHGRNTAKLRDLSDDILALDIQLENVERVRERFADDRTVKAALNNGYDMAAAVEDAYTLVYCFDAMVHFHREVVRSYLLETSRVLAPGGHGFFHHSNYTGGDDWFVAPCSRAYLDRELFVSYVTKAGLEVLCQRVIDWGGHRNLDCLSLVRKPA